MFVATLGSVGARGGGAAPNSFFGADAARAAALLLPPALAVSVGAGVSDDTVAVFAGGGRGGAKLPILKFGLNILNDCE